MGLRGVISRVFRSNARSLQTPVLSRRTSKAHRFAAALPLIAASALFGCDKGSPQVDSSIFALPVNYAVSPTGDKLYSGINAGANSRIRVYDVDQSAGEATFNGIDITGPYFTLSNYSSPAGTALAGSNLLFVTDSNIGRILMFDLSKLPGDPFVRAITDKVRGKGHLHGIATVEQASGDGAPYYKIYVSRKIANGEIYVYTYRSGNVSYEKTITGLQWPSQLKVVEDKLYVKVNDINGENIRVYDTSDESFISKAHIK